MIWDSFLKFWGIIVIYKTLIYGIFKNYTNLKLYYSFDINFQYWIKKTSHSSIARSFPRKRNETKKEGERNREKWQKEILQSNFCRIRTSSVFVFESSFRLVISCALSRGFPDYYRLYSIYARSWPAFFFFFNFFFLQRRDERTKGEGKREEEGGESIGRWNTGDRFPASALTVRGHQLVRESRASRAFTVPRRIFRPDYLWLRLFRTAFGARFIECLACAGHANSELNVYSMRVSSPPTCSP